MEKAIAKRPQDWGRFVLSLVVHADLDGTQVGIDEMGFARGDAFLDGGFRPGRWRSQFPLTACR